MALFEESIYIYTCIIYVCVLYICMCIYAIRGRKWREREKSLKTLFHSSSYFQRLYNSLTRGLFAFVWSFSSDFLLKKNYWAIRKNSMQFK